VEEGEGVVEEGVEELEVVEVQMEWVEEVEVVEVQMEGVEEVEVDQMEWVEDVEVVDVQMGEVEEVEVVEVQMDEVRAELEFADMLDELQPDDDEEVSRHVLLIINLKTKLSLSFVLQFGPIPMGVPVEQPRVRPPVIDRPAGVTHPLPERHNAGALDRVCRQCNARHFEEERLSMGHFSTCCNNGQVTAAGQRVLLQAPYLLMNLLLDDSQDGRRYRSDIRRYNNVLAFAAFSCDANDRRFRGRGTRPWVVHGQTYQRINNEVAVGGNENYCQLYFLESGQANVRRLDMARQGNHELSETVMQQLDGLLRDINPYAMAFM
jgi:hypothetical protein